MKKKENDAPPKTENTDTTTGERTKRGIRSLPSLPDSHPLFKRGFVVGGRGFNRPRPRKESK